MYTFAEKSVDMATLLTVFSTPITFSVFAERSVYLATLLTRRILNRETG